MTFGGLVYVEVVFQIPEYVVETVLRGGLTDFLTIQSSETRSRDCLRPIDRELFQDRLRRAFCRLVVKSEPLKVMLEVGLIRDTENAILITSCLPPLHNNKYIV